MDILSELADSVLAIKSDAHLRNSFLKILEVGSYTQQTRVDKISNEIEKYNPPENVKRLLKLLKDDKIANVVYMELSKPGSF